MLLVLTCVVAPGAMHVPVEGVPTVQVDVAAIQHQFAGGLVGGVQG